MTSTEQMGIQTELDEKWPEQAVERFIGRFGKASYRLLAQHAALPLVLTPELVHYLRTEFLRDEAVPWEAEVDLLLSDLCSQVGYELYAMDTQIRAYLLAQMAGDSFWQQRKQEVAQVLISYVNFLSRIDPHRRQKEREAQRWAAMLYLGDQRAVEEIAERLAQLTDGMEEGEQSERSVRAELARLTRIVQELESELQDNPALLEYANLVQQVLRDPEELDAQWMQTSYEVGNRVLRVSPGMLPPGAGSVAGVTMVEGFPPLQRLNFQTAQYSVSATSAFPPLVERSVEVITLIAADGDSSVVTPTARVGGDSGAGLSMVLRSFPFTVVTVESIVKTEAGRELVLVHEESSARLFEEPLGEDLALEMVEIPAGTFLMGSPRDEPQRQERERPQHQVKVSGFFMGRYPVTQEQWQFVAGLPEIECSLDPEPSRFKGRRRPVERVSWQEVTEFCARLSQYAHKDYRLPSEAEWEYACRANTTTPFHFGMTISADLASYRASVSYNGGPKGKDYKKTVDVDYFDPANAFGLSGMHGNVWEWCADYWHSNYEGAPTDGSVWIEGGEGGLRVRRGGSWACSPDLCRSAYRLDLDPASRNYDPGFRVVVSAPSALPSRRVGLHSS